MTNKAFKFRNLFKRRWTKILNELQRQKGNWFNKGKVTWKLNAKLKRSKNRISWNLKNN